MKYHFKIHTEKSGFWAECIELQGCHTQARTRKELLLNMEEVLNLFLDEPHNSQLIFPLPDPKVKIRKNICAVGVDPQISFAFLLRRTRLIKNLTQVQMKELLNFNSIFSYQKLEKSKYANPTLKSLIKIKEALPEFPIELLVA